MALFFNCFCPTISHHPSGRRTDIKTQGKRDHGARPGRRTHSGARPRRPVRGSAAAAAPFCGARARSLGAGATVIDAPPGSSVGLSADGRGRRVALAAVEGPGAGDITAPPAGESVDAGGPQLRQPVVARVGTARKAGPKWARGLVVFLLAAILGTAPRATKHFASILLFPLPTCRTTIPDETARFLTRTHESVCAQGLCLQFQ